MAGMFGTGSGTTSVTQNIGVLAVTKVIPKFLEVVTVYCIP